MNTPFQAVCEAAAADWDVPALVAGYALGDASPVVSAVGCDPGERFRIASVTKPMTAALVLSLLDPEEQAGVWEPDVRVRHLLAHTSGYDCELPNAEELALGDGDDALARRVAELPRVRRFLPADDTWSYANSGYWLAGHLAAERSGMPFEDALAARVLGPAGLGETSFAEPELVGTGADALPGPYPRSRRPSGGLTSTLADVLRFGRFLLGSAVGARMRVPRGKPVGGVYGLGLFGERVAGVDVWGHSGSWGGFQSSLLVVPDRGAVFAGLTNASLGSKALRRIEDVFFTEAIGAPRRVPSVVPLTHGQRAAFAGTYANGEMTYEVAPAGDGIALREGGDEVVGVPIGARTFLIPSGERVNERFDFPRAGFGRFRSRLAERV